MSEKIYVPGYGPLGAKLLILGDSPTTDDVDARKPLQGSPGRELNRLCKDAGINRDDCWITTVSKFAVTPNYGKKKIPFAVRAKNDGIDIAKQLEELQQEINSIKPNCILALGSSALWALSGKTSIGNYRGSIMFGMGRKFVPSYHPAGLLHQSETGTEFKGYWNRHVMVFDFIRALNQSRYPEYNIPKRVLQVAKNSYDLFQFIERYKGQTRVAVDIEARGHCLPVCIGLAFNKNHGMCAPLWNVDGISTIPDTDLVNIWRILSEVLARADVVGQNFNYDRDKIKRLGFIIKKLASDIMMKGFAINPELPKRQAFNQSIYTEEPFYKDEGMYEGSVDDLLTGCARDACVCWEIDEAMDADIDELQLRPFYENFLMKLPDFYWKLEQTGFNVDENKRTALLHKYIEWDEKIRYELYKLVGAEINLASPKQVATLLFDNLKLPQRDGTGEEELTALLNLQSFKNEEHRRIVELVLEGRRVRRTISNEVMALPDYDGRMRTTVFMCLETGRTSNGQQDPPIRPTLEYRDEMNKPKKKALGTAFQTKTKHGDIGADVREMYVVDPGEIFVQLDSSQAEARVTSLLALDSKMLAMYDTHDIHALTASWFFGGDESKYSKKVLGYECPERFIGKTLRHSGERGAKKRRAATEVNTSARKYKVPIKVTEAQAEAALNIFHRMCPNIENVYFKSVVECLQNHRRVLFGPLPYGIDSPVGPPRTFFERWGDDLFRQAFSYIPQRAVTDNTKAAGIRIIQLFEYARIIVESHDALLFSIPETKLGEFVPVAMREMERPINFSVCSLQRPELSIPCEVETGYNYKDLSKFKFTIKAPTFMEVELPPVRKLSVTEQFTVGPKI